MSSIKDKYFRDLEEFIVEPIYVGNGISDFEKEVQENMLTISMSYEIARESSVSDFLLFFEKLIQNRRNQLELYPDSRMLFYVWFDEQASQLRLNLISAEHTIPPFGVEIKYAPLQEIISDFLTSDYLEGIPLAEFSQNNSGYTNTEFSKYTLKVYYLLI